MRASELNQRIKKARKRVEESKVAYDRASKELKNLLEKKKLIQADEIMDAIAKSGKTYEEVLQSITKMLP